ncbi:MAG: GNAT family N-acetyltransferase [Oscillospiraceae bacterium]|jgi:ribosomal protein S18 acetylase RimI-like enzyme|nr:GNAT family N-acetyltransferase [Oscillospiraceae bacterium]
MRNTPIDIVPFDKEYLDAIQELDTNLWLALHFNDDYKPENAFCAVVGGRLVGVACLSLDASFYAMDRDIPHKLLYNMALAADAPQDAADQLIEALTGRCDVYNALYPGKEICVSANMETDDIDGMRLLMRHGFGLYGVIPVLQYDLDKKVKPVALPDEIQIIPYELTDASIKRYLEADRAASGFSASEAEIRFNKEGPGFCCFCAVRGDDVVGSVTIWDITESRGATENIFVVPAYRRRNIARALIATALGALKKEGKKTAALSVSGTNMSAMKLYISCGYELSYNLLEMRFKG